MTDLFYPIQCDSCKSVVGYVDFDNTDCNEHTVEIYCKYCIVIIKRVKDGDNKQ